jgi:hypothetical protein
MREKKLRPVDDAASRNGHKDSGEAVRGLTKNGHPPVPRDARRPNAGRRALAEARAVVRDQPALSLILLLLALGLVPSLIWAAWPTATHEPTARPDPRYASQSGSAQRTRQTHIEARADEDIDSAVETCGGVGLQHLASKYGMAGAEPEQVARRFAREYEHAFRGAAYEGCLHGLLHGG